MADDAEYLLIQSSQRGDHRAFEQLVRNTSRLVYAHLLLIVRNTHRAEDLTQETYLAAWKGLNAEGSLPSLEGFRSWLLTVARNVAIDAMRADGRKKRTAPGLKGAREEPPDRSPGPDAAADLSEQQEHLIQTLESLPEEYRQPLILRYLAGADHETMRRQLHLSDGALRGLLHRGMAMLRERMTGTETRT